MAYDSSTGLISPAVSIYDLQRAFGNSSPDLGTLCQASQINKFAKWKPFRNASIYFANDASRLSAAKLKDFGCGIVSCSRSQFASKYQDQWMHLYPRGKDGGGAGVNEVYRLVDFNGYQQNKWQLGAMPNGRGYYTIFNGYIEIPGTQVSDLDTIYFNMQCRENEDIDAYTGLLYPYDFDGANTDISDYYVGLAILDSNGCWVYSDQQVSDFYSGTNLYTGVRAQISSSIANGALKIAPVLTELRTLDYVQGGWTNDSSKIGDIIILDGAYLSATKVAQTANLQTDVAFAVDSTKVTLTFTVSNHTGSPVTISNLICYLLSDAAYMNEAEVGFSAPDYKGIGAARYISQEWPQYKQDDIYLHDWTGESENPDPLAARYYNAYTDFVAQNGGTNVIGNNTTRTWQKTLRFNQDGYGAYSNGVWALLCLAPTNNYFVREYNNI